MDAEFGCILGQPLHATPCVVGLLPPQALWPSRNGVWAEAVLIVACSCRGNIALVGLTRFQGWRSTLARSTNLGVIGPKQPCRAAWCVSIRRKWTQLGHRPAERRLSCWYPQLEDRTRRQ